MDPAKPSGTCETCACLGTLVEGIGPGPVKEGPEGFGTCRREPPKVVVVGTKVMARFWPMVHIGDWCHCHIPAPLPFPPNGSSGGPG